MINGLRALGYRSKNVAFNNFTKKSAQLTTMLTSNNVRGVHSTSTANISSNSAVSHQKSGEKEIGSLSNIFKQIKISSDSNKEINFHQTENQHVIFKLPEQANELSLLLKSNPSIQILDSMDLQIKDLIKLENPSLHPMSKELYDTKITEKLNGKSMQEYGNWVYYPWRNSLVHVLDKDDFVRVRTIRNVSKILPEEQQALEKKTVLVIGLSVGQAAAMVLAMERSCGHLVLADFDHLDLSNMNRLRASVMDLGIMKGTLIKRAIAELDPYLKVTFLEQGLNKDNIATVLGSSPETKLIDLVIEECDSFDTKVLVRKHCRKVQIPVVMETSDRGLLDIERFDLDKDYPILHGLIQKELLEVDQFSPEQKRALVVQFISIPLASKRGVESFFQVGKTLTSWPQLASEVQFGSSVAGMVTRMILLGEKVPSQRQYLDVKQQIENYVKTEPKL